MLSPGVLAVSEQDLNPLAEAAERLNFKNRSRPQLFGRPDGLCFPFERYLAAHQETLDRRHYADGERLSRKAREYHHEALVDLCKQLASVILTEKFRADRGGYRFVATEYEKSWIYAFLSYSTKHKQAPPPDLLGLVFDAMGCRSLSPSPEFAAQIGIAGADLDNRAQAVMAAELEGVADAEGKHWSENALGKEVGVSRPTINRWRQREDYRATRDFSREVHLEHLEIWRSINGDS